MSVPPPPPPPPGPPPPPAAMAPPALSKKDQHGRSALLGDISKGMQLKSSKHLMNDKSNPLLNAKGGNEGKGGAGGMRPAVPSNSENGYTRGNTAKTSSSGGTISTGGVKNAPPGLGDLFSSGVPKLKSTTGSGTVGRVSHNRLCNGTDLPPPPPSSKPSFDHADRGASVGKSGLPPPPPELSSSRPLPGTPKLPFPSPNTRPPVPGPAPPPPSRVPPPIKPSSSSNENGFSGHGNVRPLPSTPGHPPPPPPTRMDSAVRLPPPPPNRNLGSALPPPPPVRVPPNGQPTNVGRPPQPTKVMHQQSQSSAPPPPPPPGRPPPLNRNNSVQNKNNYEGGDFETNFKFTMELPRPDHYQPSVKTYPSQNTSKGKSNNSVNRRPCPPPPPPGGL